MIIGMFIVYFVISVFTYIVFAQDKQKAIEARWRTPEKRLMLLMIFGGSPGAFVAMKKLHHKNRKWYFWAIGTIGIILQLTIIVYAIYVENFA